MAKYRHALCIFAGLFASSTGDAPAQQVPSASAAKVCLEKITELYGSGLKHVGPVETLPGASLSRWPSKSTGPDIVRDSDVRLFRARSQVTNFLGKSFDSYDVCFFEKRGTSYRFIQICATKGLTSTFERCNLKWLVTDSWYDKVKKEQKEMEKERRKYTPPPQ